MYSYRLKCHKSFEKCFQIHNLFSLIIERITKMYIFWRGKFISFESSIIHDGVWTHLLNCFACMICRRMQRKRLLSPKMPLLSDVLKFLINMHLMKSFSLVMSWKQMPCVVWRYIYRGSPAELVFPFLSSRRYCSSVLCQEKGWRSRDINI